MNELSKGKNYLLILFTSLFFCLSISLHSWDIDSRRVLSTGVYNGCITQDKEGLLWIGTWGRGLMHYDGYELKELKVKDESGPVKIVPSIFVDSKGIIWFLGLGVGLFSYDKNSGLYKCYKNEANNPNSLTSNRFYWLPKIIAEDKKENIWIGTADGLNSYDKKTGNFTQYRHNPDNSNSLSNNSIWTVFVDSNNYVWVGTENGLNCYDQQAKKFICYKHSSENPNGLGDNFICAIAEDKEKNIWVGTKNSGIDKFDSKTGIFTHYKNSPTNSNSISYNEISDIMIDRFDNLWISNAGGVGIDCYNHKTNLFQKYSHDYKDPHSLSSNTIVCAFEDSAGILWIVDFFGDINKCKKITNIIKVYSNKPNILDSISSNVAIGMYEDKKHNIWLGTHKGGLCLYKGDGFINIKPTNYPHSLPDNSVYSILDAAENKVWLGIDKGFISLFDTARKQVIKNFKNPYSSDTPRNLTKDNKHPEEIWFSSVFSGLFKFNTLTGEFTQYKHIAGNPNSLSNDTVLCILQDGNMLWIGTYGGGLDVMNKVTGEFIHYRHDPNDANSISGNIIITSYIGKNGEFWVTTDDGGLNRFDKQTGRFTHYGAECGFPSNSTRHILEDKQGYLWISTDSGIVKFDTQKHKVLKLLTVGDGFPENQFNIYANVLKDSNSNFWFSTLKGLCKFNPEDASKIESNPHIPSIILSSFKSKEGTYNETGIKILTNVELPWPDNSFEFTFASLDYMDPENNQYAYKLEGFDKDWKHIGTNNFGQYSNLNPGEYTLRLKGSNNNSLWNEEGISIKITIMPPFWMTSWFKGLAGIVVLSIIGGVVHLRIRSLKKKAIYMRDHGIAEVTAQVAHDIRSPLAALSTALRDLKELPEQKRILIRNATRRISDIANNLLVKYKIKEDENVIEDGNQKDMKAELVSSILDSLISEKRVQMTEKSIDLILKLGNNTHGRFVNLEPENFKRTISNLINNASEAIETKGVIRVCLTEESDSDLVIKIIDNGKGISEDILLKIRQGIITSSKKKGHGIGISSAIQNIKSWGGSYDIQSKVGEGTTFIIKLPITEEPDWFQGAITLSPNAHIIVLDDDESIHNIWQTHFSAYLENKLITLNHINDSSAFREYCETSRSENDLFLVDYELVNANDTGLDLIEQLDLKKQSILVTSRYEEEEVRERIKELGIKIIPKNFAPYIPISRLNGTVKEEQPDLILLDDDEMITNAWEMQASIVEKKITTFNHSEDFKKVMNFYNKDIPIYIDSDLNEQIPGEMFAKFLYEQGFQNLYLATGYERDRFGDLPWIKDIVTKEPPF